MGGLAATLEWRSPERWSLAALVALALAFLGLTGLTADRRDEGATAPSADYGKLPLSFVPNKGQTDSRVRYHAQAGGFLGLLHR